jgi:photosystem II oxygen-evolving enhancer protein 2
MLAFVERVFHVNGRCHRYFQHNHVCTALSLPPGPRTHTSRRVALRLLLACASVSVTSERALGATAFEAVTGQAASSTDFPLELFTDPEGAFSLLRPSAWANDRVISTRQFARSSGVGVGPGVAFSLLLDPTENVSVLARPTPPGFTIAALGKPHVFAEGLMKTITSAPGPTRFADVVSAQHRESDGNLYYTVEYEVRTFQWARHNICVAVMKDGMLYTLNAQVPAEKWRQIAKPLRDIAQSFTLLT